MSWDIEDIINASLTRVKLTFNDNQPQEPRNMPVKTQVVQGFLTDDTVNMAAQATFADLGDNAPKPDFIDKIKNFFTNTAFFKDIQALDPMSTVAYWQGSEKPTFNISLLFINYKTGDPKCNPLKNVAALNCRCFPICGNAAGIFDGSSFQAPMNYGPLLTLLGFRSNTAQQSLSQEGTCTLEIGRWFRAMGLLLQNSTFEVSKECDPTGVPIYAKGSVQLQTWRLITYKEYLDFFLLK